MVSAYLIVWQIPVSAAERLLGLESRTVDAGIYPTKHPTPAPHKDAVPTVGASDVGEDFESARLNLHLSLMQQVPELKAVIMTYPTYKQQVAEHAMLGRARTILNEGGLFS